MLMLAMEPATFGIYASFATTAGLGIAALIRASRGDHALKEASKATALWTQTSALIDQLQEENKRHQQSIEGCEQRSVEAKAAHGLVLAELAELKMKHLELALNFKQLESQP